MSQQMEIGTLVVVVLKAQHLHQPSFYKQDPYAQAYFSGLKKRTKVNPKGGQHPVWDDELRFPVFADVGKDKENRLLEISCYKEEQRGDDVLLGKGTVDIAETLKTGEFDDWVPLETSAGPRGEVYLEMTFYANSPPPLTRRPSKISPSDRLARPATYFAQGGHPTSKSTSTSPSPQPWGVAGKPGQLSRTSASQIPSSLIPAHASQHTSSDSITTFGVAVKHKDNSLPPLPANSNPSDIDSGRNLEHPTSLHPGECTGPKPTLPNRATNPGRPLPKTLPDQLHRRTLSDTPALAPSLVISQLLAPYSTGIASMTGERVSSTPSIVVKDHIDDYPPLAFPTPFPPSPGPAQRRGSWGYTTSGDYGPADRAYLQPNSQSYIPAPAQGHPQTVSPPPRPIPRQPPYTPPGQPQQLYESLAITPPPPPHQQYPIEPATTQSLLPPPQLPNAKPQTPYLPQPQQLFHQQPFLPPPQLQQSDPQCLVYTQTLLNGPQISQQHSHLDLSLSSQSPATAAQLQQPLYSQTPQQSSFAVPPPPPPVRSQTPQPHTSQPPRPQSYFSPPPPPPPPPPSYSQVGQGLSLAASVAQPSRTQSAPIQESIPPPTSISQSVVPPAHLLQSPTTMSRQMAPGTEENFIHGQTEQGKNIAELVTVTKEGSVLREAGETLGEMARNQANKEQGQMDDLRVAEEQKVCYAREHRQDEDEQKKQQEIQSKRKEEEQRKREDGERRKQEEETLRREEEHRKLEEEHKRQEEERRKEECRRREEEERRKQEDHRRQEEARMQREREESECRRKASEEDARRKRAEEAAAERRWQEELARIRARAKQEAADAEFARAQMEAEEAERQRQEEADLALVRQVQEEAEREERLAQERRRQEEADMEVARREQAHEEELERRRVEERKHRMEEVDRELARRLDMELNLGTEYGGDASEQRRVAGSGRH